MSQRKVLISIFFSLSSVQIANYILPLITVPYLVRVLGPEKFGLISFAQAFVSYFVVLANFGINLYGAREISIIREDKEKLSEVFASFIFGRLYLCLISSIIFILLLLAIPRLSSNYEVFLITFCIIFTEFLFPVWFFQGMERMKYIAVMNFIGKSLLTISIFLVIKKEGDYLFLPLLNVISSFIVGIISFIVIYKHFKLVFIFPRWHSVYRTLRNSFNIFLSDVYVTFYTASYPVVLGFSTDYVYVGYYTAAQKIIQAWLGLQNLVVTTVFPHMSRLAAESRQQAINLLQKMTVICLLMSIPAAIFVYFYADAIVRLILGNNFGESIAVMQILSFLFVLALMNMHLTFQGMLSFRNDRHFNYVRLAGCLTALFVVFPLSYYFKHIGTSLAYVLSEIAVLIVSVYFLSMTKIEFISLSQIKKVALYTGIILSVVLLTTLVNNLFAGVIVTAVATLITAYSLFGHEYFLMEGKTNV